MDNLEIDYKKAAQQLRSGEALFGKDGALAPLLERILNSALEGEMDAHLSEEERSSGNRRNGKMSKKVQTKYGEVTIETPRDRDGTFQPETVKKRETIPRFFAWINLFLLNHILLYSLLFPFQSIQTYVARVPVLNGLFRLHILILSCVLYKSQPSSKKDSPRTSD